MVFDGFCPSSQFLLSMNTTSKETRNGLLGIDSRPSLSTAGLCLIFQQRRSLSGEKNKTYILQTFLLHILHYHQIRAFLLFKILQICRIDPSLPRNLRQAYRSTPTSVAAKHHKVTDWGMENQSHNKINKQSLREKKENS